MDKYNIEELEKIAGNEIMLKKAIKDTNGKIFFHLGQHSILPKIEYLMNNINQYSLNFISKNYQLSTEQKKILKDYFSNEANFSAEFKLTDLEIIDYLKNGTQLPNNTILSPDIINKYFIHFKKQTKIDEYNFGCTIGESVKLLELNEIMNLNDNFLRNYYYVMNECPKYFLEPKYKEKYIAFARENALKNNRPLTMRDFRSYIFEHHYENDRKILDEILTTVDSSPFLGRYVDFAKLNGACDIVGRYEYFCKYNNYELGSVAEADIIKNKDEIQNILIKKMEKDSHLNLRTIFRLDCSSEKLKLIIDGELFKKLNSANIAITFRAGVTDDAEHVNKYAVFLEGYVDFILDNLSFKIKDKDFSGNNYLQNNQIDINLILRELNFIGSYAALEKTKPILKNIYENIIPLVLSNENFTKLQNNGHYYFVTSNSLIALVELTKTAPSINLLNIYAKYLYDIQDKNKYLNWEETKTIKNISNLVDNLAPVLSIQYKKEVKQILNKFKIKLKKPNTGIKINESAIIHQNNFLQYNINAIDVLEEEHVMELFSINNKFQKEIIFNKIKINNDIFVRLLHDMTNYFDFIKQYTNENLDYIKNNKHLSKIISDHELGVKINKHFGESSHGHYLEYQKLSRESNLIRRDEEHTSFDEKSISNYYDRLDISEIPRKKLRENFNHKFIKDEIEKLIKNKEFYQLYCSFEEETSHSHKDIFKHYLTNIKYSELNLNLDDSYFLRLLQPFLKETRNDKDKNVNIAEYSRDENINIAKKLLKMIHGMKINDYESRETTIFNLFPEQSLDKFVNKFVCENMPLAMFYCFDLHPTREKPYYGKRFVRHSFTNKQILEAYEMLENGPGFLSELGANSDFASFFNNNFNSEGEKNLDQGLNQYLELLDICKNKHKKLYLFLLSRETLTLFSRKLQLVLLDSCKDKIASIDDLNNRFMVDNFNVDTLIDGVNELILNAKDNPQHQDQPYDNKKSINYKLLQSSIAKLIYTSYYDRYDENQKNIYVSHMNLEDSEKIIEYFFNQSFLFMLTNNKIGCVFDVAEHIIKNFEKFITIKNENNIIDMILKPKEHHLIDRSCLYNNEYNQTIAFIYINGLIDYFIKNNDTNKLGYLTYIIDQHQFNNQELRYGQSDVIGIENYDSSVLDFVCSNTTIMEKTRIVKEQFMLDSKLYKIEEKSGNKNIKQQKI